MVHRTKAGESVRRKREDVHARFHQQCASDRIGGGLGLASAGGANADDHMVKLAVVERAATDTVTDTGDKGDTVGDILTFANEVYDEANAKLVGHDNGWCVRTVVGKAWECFWTLDPRRRPDHGRRAVPRCRRFRPRGDRRYRGVFRASAAR